MSGIPRQYARPLGWWLAMLCCHLSAVGLWLLTSLTDGVAALSVGGIGVGVVAAVRLSGRLWLGLPAALLGLVVLLSGIDAVSGVVLAHQGQRIEAVVDVVHVERYGGHAVPRLLLHRADNGRPLTAVIPHDGRYLPGTRVLLYADPRHRLSPTLPEDVGMWRRAFAGTLLGVSLLGVLLVAATALAGRQRHTTRVAVPARAAT